MKNKINNLLSYKNCFTLAFINFIFALFVDSILVYKNFEINHIESYFHITWTNIAFIVFTVLTIVKGRNVQRNKFSIKEIVSKHYPIIILLFVVCIMAFSQFDITAIYDAHLYYGSFIEGIKLCDLTIKTEFGAFINWGHEFLGTALFLVPVELCFFGEMYGSYFVNTVLMLVTMVVFYKYLSSFLPSANKWLITFSVAAFVFMPYSFNLITYFCPDYYLELYLIWLLYAYKKDNQIMISFIGFLMCTTKDSGAFLYGFFVLLAYVFDCLYQYKNTGYKFWRIKNIPFAKFVLWLIPAFIYGAVFLFREKIQLQVFYAAGELSFGLKPYDLSIQALQDFVFGFRWVLSAIVLLALAVWACKRIFGKYKSKKERYIEGKYYPVFLALIGSSLLLHALFSVFTLSHCARYTSPLNVVWAMAFALSLVVLSKKDVVRGIISLALSAILVIQLYWTIDPVIIKNNYKINTGNHNIYSLGNLANQENGFFTQNIGDYYVYNNEWSVYTDLVNQTLRHFNPKTDVSMFVWGVYDYELHLGGNQYGLYWDWKNQRQTYKKSDHTINVYHYTINYQDPVIEKSDFDLLVIIPARMNSTEFINNYLNAGYTIVDQFTASNSYGNMTLYQFRYTK